MAFLQKISKGGNERTLAIKEETWKEYRKQQLILTGDFLYDASDTVFEKEEEKAQERKTRFDLATDMWTKFMTLGADYLNRVYQDMERLKLLTASDREVLRISALSIAKGNLSDRQVKRLTQIFVKLDKDTDYIIPSI